MVVVVKLSATVLILVSVFDFDPGLCSQRWSSELILWSKLLAWLISLEPWYFLWVAQAGVSSVETPRLPSRSKNTSLPARPVTLTSMLLPRISSNSLGPVRAEGLSLLLRPAPTDLETLPVPDEDKRSVSSRCTRQW